MVYLTEELYVRLTQQQEQARASEDRGGKSSPVCFRISAGGIGVSASNDFKAAWKTACKRAGCPWMLRHDSRRTAVHNLERAGVPRSSGMKIPGHRTESVYTRDYIVSDADLQMGRDKLERHSSVIVDANRVL